VGRYAPNMASRVQHPRLTGEDFEALQAEYGWSFDAELINGEAVVIPPDGSPASSAQGELHYALRRWQDSAADGGLVLQNVFVKVDPSSRFGPDVAWWSAARRPPLPQGQMTVIPDWVAEVLSPSTRENDLGLKRERYLAAGVRELWLVDPSAGSVLVVGADGREQVAGERVASRVLAGFTVEVARLFAGV